MTKPLFVLALPYYRHDCDVCRFVGNMRGCDCYTCGDSVIMRYGNDCPDYGSMPRCLAAIEPGYKDALELEQRIVATGGFQV